MVSSSLWSCRLKPITAKLGFTASMPDAQDYGDGVENKLASLLFVPLGKALSRIPPLKVVDKWSAIPKRARYGVLIAIS